MRAIPKIAQAPEGCLSYFWELLLRPKLSRQTFLWKGAVSKDPIAWHTLLISGLFSNVAPQDMHRYPSTVTIPGCAAGGLAGRCVQLRQRRQERVLVIAPDVSDILKQLRHIRKAFFPGRLDKARIYGSPLSELTLHGDAILEIPPCRC